MTDEQVLARAAAAGWVWHDAADPCPRWPGSVGWATSDHSFTNARRGDPDAKIGMARHAFDHDRDCAECGRPCDANWDHISRTVCCDCHYWVQLVRRHPADDPTRVVVNGVHFLAGSWSADVGPYPPGDAGRFNGFGGRRFVVKFHAGPNAGKTLTTYDLWHQGSIPELFRDRLPDNAVFAENTSAVQP